MAHSEVELDGQLDLPWPAGAGSGADRVESAETETAAALSAGEIGYVARGIECRRHVEETPLSVIPDIVELDPELKGARFLAERDIFEDRHVPVFDPGSANRADGRIHASAPNGGGVEARRVDRGVQRPVPPGQVRVATQHWPRRPAFVPGDAPVQRGPADALYGIAPNG